MRGSPDDDQVEEPRGTRDRARDVRDRPASVREAGARVDASAAVAYTAADEGDHVMKVVFEAIEGHKKAQRAQGFSVSAEATVAAIPATPGTVWTYTVAAVNAVGPGPWSNAVTLTAI